MLKARQGCYFCFKTLDPFDESIKFQSFSTCSNCHAVYHTACWLQSEKCVKCGENVPKTIEVPPPNPLKVVMKTASVPIKPSRVIYLENKKGVSPLYVSLGGITLLLLAWWMIADFRDVTPPDLTPTQEINLVTQITPTHTFTPTETPTPTKTVTPTPLREKIKANLSESIPTATLTLIPVTPLTPIPTSVILLRDDFNQNQGWKLNSNENADQSIRNGKLSLILNNLSDEAVTWTTVDETFEDFVLEVDAIYEEGVSNHEYGVLIRKENDENFYQFALANETFNAWKYENDGWVKLRGNTFNTFIKPIGETNRLKIVTLDKQLQFYVNDRLLITLEDDSFQSGDIALFGAIYNKGRAKISFDNLVVHELKNEKRLATSTPLPSNNLTPVHSNGVETFSFDQTVFGQLSPDQDKWYTFIDRSGDTIIFFMFDPNVNLDHPDRVQFFLFDQKQIPEWPPENSDVIANIGSGGPSGWDRDGNGGTGELLWRGGSLRSDTRYYLRFVNRSNSIVKYCITSIELFDESCF